MTETRAAEWFYVLTIIRYAGRGGTEYRLMDKGGKCWGTYGVRFIVVEEAGALEYQRAISRISRVSFGWPAA